MTQPKIPDLHDQVARDLLTPLWRGIDADYKGRYRRNIWQQFEANIRSAAYTSSLARFLDTMCTRLGIAVSESGAESIAGFRAWADETATLRALRNETTLLVLLVRVQNEDRKKGTHANLPV